MLSTPLTDSTWTMGATAGRRATGGSGLVNPPGEEGEGGHAPWRFWTAVMSSSAVVIVWYGCSQASGGPERWPCAARPGCGNKHLATSSRAWSAVSVWGSMICAGVTLQISASLSLRVTGRGRTHPSGAGVEGVADQRRREVGHAHHRERLRVGEESRQSGAQRGVALELKHLAARVEVPRLDLVDDLRQGRRDRGSADRSPAASTVEPHLAERVRGVLGVDDDDVVAGVGPELGHLDRVEAREEADERAAGVVGVQECLAQVGRLVGGEGRGATRAGQPASSAAERRARQGSETGGRAWRGCRAA